MATKSNQASSSRGKGAEKKVYSPEEAVAQMRAFPQRKFDETVEIHVKLGVNPTKAEEGVRGAVVLPAGLGKTVRVLVIAKGEKVMAAREAGADHVGAEDMIEKIQGGWMEFDTVIATPDTMAVVAKVGKILGPHGLMPNPKTGTVTFDVTKAVKEAKAGRVEYKMDKGANLHAAIGKRSFDDEKLLLNLRAFLDAIARARPAAVKGGSYLKRITLSTTMGGGVQIDASPFSN